MFLTDELITPNNELYIRNHYLVPSYDEDFEEEFELEVSLTDLKDQTSSDDEQAKKFTL